MARYKITGEVEGKSGANVKASLRKGLYADALSVVKINPATSRAARLSAAESDFDDAKSEVEALRDEMQEWYDNMPENLQGGAKGEEVQAAVDALEDIVNNIDGIDFSGVDFPGMF